jgi:hypothetical protein
MKVYVPVGGAFASVFPPLCGFILQIERVINPDPIEKCFDSMMPMYRTVAMPDPCAEGEEFCRGVVSEEEEAVKSVFSYKSQCSNEIPQSSQFGSLGKRENLFYYA